MLRKPVKQVLIVGMVLLCANANAEDQKPTPVGPHLATAASEQDNYTESKAKDEIALTTKEIPPPRTASQRQDINFQGTETLIAEYVGDNGSLNESIYGDDDNFFAFRNLLYFQASNRHFSSGIRLDTALFHHPPYYVNPREFRPGGQGYTTLNYGNDLRIERLHGTVHLGHLHATMGDFYVNFGRGMALSLIKVDDVGVDNTLRGLRLEYRIPRKLKAVIVGGVVNSLNIDATTHQLQEDDPMDRIVGARVEWEMLDALNLGVHGVYMSPRFTEEEQIPPHRQYVDQGTGVGVLTGGASLEMHLGGLHVYLEGNGQSHDNYRPIGADKDVLGESGYAAFGEVSYDLSPFNIKGEAIFYKRWLMEGPLRGSAANIGVADPLSYHHMVTLEPLWMVIKSFGNAAGGRLTGDLYLTESDTQFTLATSLIYYMGGLLPQGEWDDHPPTLVVHPTLKIRQEFGQSGIYSSVEGGFRHESTEEPEIAGEDTGFLWHLKGDVSIPLTGPHSIEIKGEVRRHELTITEGVDGEYWVTLASLGYDWSSLFGVTVVHEFSDQTSGAAPKIGEWELPLPDHHYLWLMASLHVPAPLDGLNLRFIGGSQRGGIKCAGGVCRRFPDSVGARIEAVYRF